MDYSKEIPEENEAIKTHLTYQKRRLTLRIITTLLILLCLLGILTFTLIFSRPSRHNPSTTLTSSPTPTSTSIPQPSGTVEIDPVTGWKIYRNQYFGFEIRLPVSWSLTENDTPKIQIEKDGDNSDTFVNIFPRGNAIGLAGEFRPTHLNLQEPLASAIDIILLNGSPRATYIQFKSPPATWTSEHYVWGSVEVKNSSFFCKEDRKGEEEFEGPDSCTPRDGYVGHKVHVGNIDTNDRKIIDSILESFKFIKSK